jgi:hypothetical protein
MFEDLHGLVRDINLQRGTRSWDAALNRLAPQVRAVLEKLLAQGAELEESLVRAFPFGGSRQGGRTELALAAVAAHAALELFAAVISGPDLTDTSYSHLHQLPDDLPDDYPLDPPAWLLDALCAALHEPDSPDALAARVACEAAGRLGEPAADELLLQRVRKRLNLFVALAREAERLHCRYRPLSVPSTIP